MSKYYGSVKGSAKGEATRRGTDASGIKAHVRSWGWGARTEVTVWQSPEGISPCVIVEITGGSHSPDGYGERLVILRDDLCGIADGTKRLAVVDVEA